MKINPPFAPARSTGRIFEYIRNPLAHLWHTVQEYDPLHSRLACGLLRRRQFQKPYSVALQGIHDSALNAP